MKPCMKFVLVLAVAIGLAGYEAAAKPGDLLRTFLNPTPADGDSFGRSVAGVGNNVLVGAPYDDTGATNAGAAYLFDGSTGALLQTFQNPTPAVIDYFGRSVAALGSNVLVGAPWDDAGGQDSGSAYLYNGSTGALLRTFQNPTPAASDIFGHSVAGVGGNVLVGAYHDDTGATNTGAAYLFNGSTGALLQTFLNPTPDPNDFFGLSVGAVGGNILVGAPYDDTGATGAGAAYLFDGSTGALLRTFQKPTPAHSDHFGYSVAAVGGNVLVGTPWDDTGAQNAGAAYLFDGSTGALLATFLNPTPDPNDYFGFSVAAVGGNVLVGAYADDAGATGAGAAYLFDGSTGALLETFLNPTPDPNDHFGYSVAAVGNNVLVGAYHDDTGATGAGAVYLFEGIPEPATLSLVALGGMALIRRRRRPGRGLGLLLALGLVVAALRPAAASGEWTLLGSEPRSGGSSKLYRIDRLTGAGQEIGAFAPVVPAMNGLAYDPAGDILYGISPHVDQLFRIDPATAQVTPIGQPGNLGVGNANGLAYDSIHGVLYGTDNFTNTLFTIDVSTGVGSPVGTIGGGFSNVEGLGFDARTDTLYGLADGMGGNEIFYYGQIIVIDRATANATALGDPLPSERIWRGLDFDPQKGKLIACSSSGFYWIDPADGAASRIGGMYVQGIAVVPEPGCAVLLSVAGLAVLARRWRKRAAL